MYRFFKSLYILLSLVFCYMKRIFMWFAFQNALEDAQKLVSLVVDSLNTLGDAPKAYKSGGGLPKYFRRCPKSLLVS